MQKNELSDRDQDSSESFTEAEKSILEGLFGKLVKEDYFTTLSGPIFEGITLGDISLKDIWKLRWVAETCENDEMTFKKLSANHMSTQFNFNSMGKTYELNGMYGEIVYICLQAYIGLRGRSEIAIRNLKNMYKMHPLDSRSFRGEEQQYFVNVCKSGFPCAQHVINYLSDN